MKYCSFVGALFSSISRTGFVFCKKAVDDTLLCLFAPEDDSEDDDAIAYIKTLLVLNLSN